MRPPSPRRRRKRSKRSERLKQGAQGRPLQRSPSPHPANRSAIGPPLSLCEGEGRKCDLRSPPLWRPFLFVSPLHPYGGINFAQKCYSHTGHKPDHYWGIYEPSFSCAFIGFQRASFERLHCAATDGDWRACQRRGGGRCQHCGGDRGGGFGGSFLRYGGCGRVQGGCGISVQIGCARREFSQERQNH